MSGERNNMVDRGWLNMEQLLDQEMPVQKKRRKILWLPILGFLLFLIGGFLLHTTSDSSTNSIEEVGQSFTNNSNLLSEQKDNNNLQKNISPITNSTSNHNQSEISFETNPTISAFSNSKGATNQLLVNQILKNTANDLKINAEGITHSKNTNPNNVAHSVVHSQEKKSLADTPLSVSGDFIEDNKAVLANESLTAFHDIMPLNINYLETSFTLNTPQTSSIHSLKSNNKSIEWIVGFKGDRLVQRGIDLIGIEAGLSKRLFSKWGLGSRVSYSKSLSSTTTSAVENTELDMSSTINTGAEFDNAEFAESFAAPTLHLMEVLLTPEYYFKNKLTAFGGLAIGYQWGDITYHNIQNTSGIRASEPGTIAYSSLIYGVTTGLNYNPLKRVSIGLEYSIYLNPLATESKEQQLRLLPAESLSHQKVGLRFRFMF